jgi:hypothetical protein
MGVPEILIFSALLGRKPGSFFRQKTLKPLRANAFIFNQQALGKNLPLLSR